MRQHIVLLSNITYLRRNEEFEELKKRLLIFKLLRT